MLEKAVLYNFQIHQKKVIKFDPGVSCICGPTDAGKSSALRFLRWVMLNEVEDSSFTTHGTDSTTGKLWVDGNKIVRSKSKSTNRYSLNGKDFSSVRKDVPDEIARLLNVDEGNFQQQFDSHFWLADTAGQVGRGLNKIVNLEAIDEAMAKAATKLRSVRSAVEISENRLDDAKRKAKDLEWVPLFASDLDKVEGLIEESEKVREKASALRDLLEQATKVQEEAEVATQAKNQGLLVLQKVDAALKAKERVGKLRTLLTEAANVTENRERTTEASEKGKAVLEMVTVAMEARKEVDGLRKLLKEAKTADESRAKALEEAEKLSKRIEKETEGRCVLCKQIVKKGL
jgi:hypothetical protein